MEVYALYWFRTDTSKGCDNIFALCETQEFAQREADKFNAAEEADSYSVLRCGVKEMVVFCEEKTNDSQG